MRRFDRPSAAPFALAALLCASLALGACASGGSDAGSSEPAGEQAAKEAPAKGVAPPAGHPLAKIEARMRPDQVRKLMGEPDSIHHYPGAIWKMFIPFYYGSDSGTRIEYGYAGEGRVVFATNRWSGQETVVRVDYDPNETGE